MTANEDGEYRQGAMVAATSDVTVASRYLESLEDLNANQKGVTVEDNRPSIARALNISVSSVHNLRRHRRKSVPSWLRDKIVSLFIEVAQNEIRLLEHEIAVAKQVGMDPRDGALVAACARAAALHALLQTTVGSS